MICGEYYSNSVNEAVRLAYFTLAIDLHVTKCYDRKLNPCLINLPHPLHNHSHTPKNTII